MECAPEKVDKLVKALGLSGVDKSKVSRINKELDLMVNQFRNRPLQAAYPYVWLDAIALKVRQIPYSSSVRSNFLIFI